MNDIEFYLKDIWNKTLQEFTEYIKVDLSIPPEIVSYFDSTELAELYDSVATVLCDRYVTYSLISAHQIPLDLCISKILNHPVKIRFMEKSLYVKNDEFNSRDLSKYSKSLIQNYTFSNFVTGRSNISAHLASVTVANNLGCIYNPLFIYGDSGLGKTHLLTSIGNHVKMNFKGKKIGYITGSEFVEKIYDSLKNGYISEFKEDFSQLDLLLVDDIQFIAGKEKTHEIFFSIFNSIKEHGGQICLTADKNPSDIKGLEDRLVTRFIQGLSVNIESPEFETSVSILKQKIANNVAFSLLVEEDVVNYIATNFSKNIRALEGALNRLFFYSINFSNDSHNKNITLSLAMEAFKNEVSTNNSNLTTEKIKSFVCDYYNITKNQIISKQRTKNIAYARHIAIYLCRELLQMPYHLIGLEFGKRDHSTVISSVEKITKEISTNSILKKVIDDLKIKLKN